MVNGEIISNFSQKASIFNKFFVSQSTPLQNSSILLPFNFYMRTDETPLSLYISNDDIFLLLKT